MTKTVVGVIVAITYLVYQILKEAYQAYTLSKHEDARNKEETTIIKQEEVIKNATKESEDAVNAYKNSKSDTDSK